MKKILLSLGCLFLLTFSTLTLANTNKTTSMLNKQQVLFVLLAKQGTIHEEMNKPGQYQLTLKTVNPEIIYFADRPARFANHINIAEFIKRWQTGTFKMDPPNAVVEAMHLNGDKTKDKHAVSYAIVLQNPLYDKTTDQLRFDIKRLSGDTTPLPIIASSNYLALFVDSACLSCF